ncbi:MAG: hypothetical protein H6587_12760 [Flavobacteriales bacterium]|nr:hypothetical protein [Flavobacteriales bacterium]MCB9365435.1 hypothetical protein [Flavobacteriales bacterium]
MNCKTIVIASPYRHYEGGTTEVIYLINGQITSVPTHNANPIPRNDV